MDWYPWQKELTKCRVIIHYDENHQLYPISDWLHPGLIPIGDGEFDELFQDLSNLEWFLRHLGWLGFYNVNVVSNEPLRGLDHICKSISSNLKITFDRDYWFSKLSKVDSEYEHVILVSGLYLTNSDLRNAFLLHLQRGNDATLLAIRGLEFQVGLVTYQENHLITEFKEKPIDKTQLVNSGLLILNLKSQKLQQVLDEFESNVLNEVQPSRNNIGTKSSDKIHQLIEELIKNKLLKKIELTGTNGEPWFLDLSKIETWIKLDPQNFIDCFSHLFNN